jgi:hypothetical protein
LNRDSISWQNFFIAPYNPRAKERLSVKMMNRAKIVSCFLLLSAVSAGAAGQKKTDSSLYDTMVARVKSGDESVDFRQLRLAYAESPAYSNGPDTTAQKHAMTTALNGKEFARAIQNADIVLAANYVDMDAHFVEHIAYRESGDLEKAKFHEFVLQQLLRSITNSGDGKTPESAYQVIDVHEEYVVLHFMHIGLPKSQSYLHKNGHAYDEIKYDDPESKEERALYFNVDIPAKHGL